MSDAALSMRGPVTAPRTPRGSPSAPASAQLSRLTTSSGSALRAALYFGTAFFPGASPLAGTLASFATARCRVPRPPAGRHHRRPPGRQGRAQAGPGRLAHREWVWRPSRSACCRPTHRSASSRRSCWSPSESFRAWHSVRMGRRDPDELRTRAMESEGAATPASCRPASRSACCWPTWCSWSACISEATGHGGLPFLASIVLVIVRPDHPRPRPRVPVFEESRTRATSSRRRSSMVVKSDWRNILRGIGLRVAETAGYAVSITYMISYLKNAGLATKTETLVGPVRRGRALVFSPRCFGPA